MGALFYAAASVVIMMVNKVALFVWKFPSVATLALSQFVFTVISLRIMKAMGWINYPEATWAGCKAVFPLPILYVGNAVSGLSGTKALSLPMFTVLRRTNMPITMALEWWLLGTTYSTRIQLSIALMLVGSVVATLLDMQFDLIGYAATMLNNLFTSVSGVMTKIKLNNRPAGEEGETAKQALSSVWGLMYMNSLLGTPLLFFVLLLLYRETLYDAWEYEHWDDPQFVFMFLLSSAMGTVLQFSIFYCTKVNSALTTVVTGVLKNVLTSYVGMLDIRLGYTFNPLNFLGVNLSMIGGIWYAYIQFVEGAAQQQERKAAVATPPPTPSLDIVHDNDNGDISGAKGEDDDPESRRPNDDEDLESAAMLAKTTSRA